MKILRSSTYSPRYASKSELDKYIGKDIWVKVYYKDNDAPASGDDWWIRILDKTPEGLLVNAFYDFQINHPSGASLESYHLNSEFTMNPRKLQVYNPVETLTTDEVMGYLAE